MATDDNTNSASDAYEIIAAQPNTPKELEVDGKRYKFRPNGMMRVKDRGEALAIRERYGKGKRPLVTTTKVNYPGAADRGHRYFFGQMPAMPWHKYDERGNRVN